MDDELERLASALDQEVPLIDFAALPAEVEDESVHVLVARNGQCRTIWKLSRGLVNHNGDVNLQSAWRKPLRRLLEATDDGKPSIYNQLITELCGPGSSIARKDGQFGVFYETRFPCDDGRHLSHDEVVTHLIRGLLDVQASFGRVEFAIPSRLSCPEGAVSVWAFIPPGRLDRFGRQTMMLALSRLYDDGSAQWKELWSEVGVSDCFAKFEQVIEDKGKKVKFTIRIEPRINSRSFGKAELFCEETAQWKPLASIGFGSLTASEEALKAPSNTLAKWHFLSDRDELLRRSRALLE